LTPAEEPLGFADQLNIATPEQVELRFAVAGLGSRFVAVLLDHLLQAAFYIVAGLLIAFLLSGSAGDKLDMAGKWAMAAFIALNFCLLWGYFSLFEAFWHGQTPGKRVMKLRVIKDSGRQITLFEALSRNLLRFVDYLPAFYLAGVITMLCNRRNQRLGDLAAGTLVVHERREPEPLLAPGDTGFLSRPDAYGSPQQPGTLFPADAVARLQAQDLIVIDTFFARALDLDLTTRAQLAQRIATQLTARMGVPLPEGNPERTLETIAYAMRSSARRVY
jgi:uncharacterized RDD family membrane protein YckC